MDMLSLPINTLYLNTQSQTHESNAKFKRMSQTHESNAWAHERHDRRWGRARAYCCPLECLVFESERAAFTLLGDRE